VVKLNYYWGAVYGEAGKRRKIGSVSGFGREDFYSKASKK